MKFNLYIMFMNNGGRWKSYKQCNYTNVGIQVGNLPLPINLYILVINNKYNLHVVFDGKTK